MTSPGLSRWYSYTNTTVVHSVLSAQNWTSPSVLSWSTFLQDSGKQHSKAQPLPGVALSYTETDKRETHLWYHQRSFCGRTPPHLSNLDPTVTRHTHGTGVKCKKYHYLLSHGDPVGCGVPEAPCPQAELYEWWKTVTNRCSSTSLTSHSESPGRWLALVSVCWSVLATCPSAPPPLETCPTLYSPLPPHNHQSCGVKMVTIETILQNKYMNGKSLKDLMWCLVQLYRRQCISEMPLGCLYTFKSIWSLSSCVL